MDAEISIEPVRRDDSTLLVVSGRLDAESAGDLRRAVEEEVRRGGHAITLGLEAVSFLSSAGIRVLFETQRAARDAGGSCRIVSMSEPVRRVLELTRLLSVLSGDGRSPDSARSSTAAADERSGAALLVGLEPPTGAPLAGAVVGSAAALAGDVTTHRVKVPRHAFALGLAAIAEDVPPADRTGELVAVCGAVYHRPPQPFAAVDYLVGTGDLVPEIEVAHGLVWHGLPSGRCGFEPADEGAVPLPDLVNALLTCSATDTIAVVVVGEIHGLVGVELIRPLTAATAVAGPLTGRRDVTASWLGFAREPVHARRTAAVVGVASRRPGGPLSEFLRPWGDGGVSGHFHAVVFPLRPLRRGPADLAGTIADLAALPPVAVMHLLDDPRPIFGSGRSEFVRGGCWFAPLEVGAETPA